MRDVGVGAVVYCKWDVCWLAYTGPVEEISTFEIKNCYCNRHHPRFDSSLQCRASVPLPSYNNGPPNIKPNDKINGLITTNSNAPSHDETRTFS